MYIMFDVIKQQCLRDRLNSLPEQFKHGSKICSTKIPIQVSTPVIFYPCDRSIGHNGLLHLADISLVYCNGDRWTDRWLLNLANYSTVHQVSTHA